MLSGLLPLLSTFLFLFIASCTPGPNNMMLLSSGINFGFRKSLPLAIGIITGVSLLAICIGLGLLQLIQQVPSALRFIKILGLFFTFYLAYRIVSSRSLKKADTNTPITFFQAMIFQFVNPKSWTVFITAFIAFQKSMEAPLWSLAIMFSALCAATAILSLSMWLSLGVQAARFLKTDRHFMIFNWTMAILLLGLMLPILLS